MARTPPASSSSPDGRCASDMVLMRPMRFASFPATQSDATPTTCAMKKSTPSDARSRSKRSLNQSTSRPRTMMAPASWSRLNSPESVNILALDGSLSGLTHSRRSRSASTCSESSVNSSAITRRSPTSPHSTMRNDACSPTPANDSSATGRPAASAPSAGRPSTPPRGRGRRAPCGAQARPPPRSTPARATASAPRSPAAPLNEPTKPNTTSAAGFEVTASPMLPASVINE